MHFLFITAVLAGTSSIPQPPASYFERITPVSVEFQRSMDEAAATIPNSVWMKLREKKWRICLARFVVDADPSLANDRPRGWPINMTWQQADAIHLPDQKLLVFAEKRRTVFGKEVLCHRMAGVLRHELGHAADMAWGTRRCLSAEDAFLASYQADVSAIPVAQRAALQYYLQPGSAGAQEAFAEAFAIRFGGGSDRQLQAQFVRSFPRVMAWIRADGWRQSDLQVRR